MGGGGSFPRSRKRRAALGSKALCPALIIFQIIRVNFACVCVVFSEDAPCCPGDETKGSPPRDSTFSGTVGGRRCMGRCRSCCRRSGKSTRRVESTTRKKKTGSGASSADVQVAAFSVVHFTEWPAKASRSVCLIRDAGCSLGLFRPNPCVQCASLVCACVMVCC